MDIERRAAQWIVAGETGSSSRAMWARMMGVTGDKNHPQDGGDLGRCLKLLEFIPEWKARLPEVSGLSPYWAALVPHWDELTKLYGNPESPNYGPVYKRMQEILRPVEDADPRVVRLSSMVTMSFGR
jgi:hypothetical protein